MTCTDKRLQERCKLIDDINSADKPILSAASDNDTKLILLWDVKSTMIYWRFDSFWETSVTCTHIVYVSEPHDCNPVLLREGLRCGREVQSI
jgi:hypothetical protein